MNSSLYRQRRVGCSESVYDFLLIPLIEIHHGLLEESSETGFGNISKSPEFVKIVMRNLQGGSTRRFAEVRIDDLAGGDGGIGSSDV